MRKTIDGTHLAALERELKLPAYLGVLDGPFVSIISKEATNRADELFTREFCPQVMAFLGRG